MTTLPQTESPLPRFQTEVGLRVLAAACDIAVLRALELVGKRVAREPRARFGEYVRSGRPWHEAHTQWTVSDATIDAALQGAWSSLPRLVNEHGCCGVGDSTLVLLLDTYVRDLIINQKAHEFALLSEALARVVRNGDS